MEEKTDIALAAGAWSLAYSIVFSPLASAAGQDIIQQQRQKAIEAQLQPQTPDVRIPTSGISSSHVRFPAKAPLFSTSRSTACRIFPHDCAVNSGVDNAPYQRLLSDPPSAFCLG